MKAFSMLASAMLAAAVALPAVAADQTKLYDPMAEAEKIVVPVELLSQDGAKPIGNVVILWVGLLSAAEGSCTWSARLSRSCQSGLRFDRKGPWHEGWRTLGSG